MQPLALPTHVTDILFDGHYVRAGGSVVTQDRQQHPRSVPRYIVLALLSFLFWIRRGHHSGRYWEYGERVGLIASKDCRCLIRVSQQPVET